MSKYYCCMYYGVNLKCKGIICRQTALYGGGRCRHCSLLGSNNPRFNVNKIDFYCKDCLSQGNKKRVSNYGNRCPSHAQILRNKNPQERENMRQSHNRPEVKNRKSEKMKRKHKDPEYQEKQRKARNLKPNKPEIFLTEWFEIIKISLDYVGDGKFWFNNPITGQNCNPDFVNEKLKKVIEYNGKYYHPIESLVRDVNKLKTYRENGYQSLIIFEKELKDLDKLKEKVLKFYNKPNKLKQGRFHVTTS